ncbi:excisionase family DNA-binding protein [Endozoicomonas sp. SM1973]|uniref:Excisionase family DNA-binding protein n=1 Tax=Spartinivicinus marinus TaxID=2994442 RepID=A0A853I790_9GAMM|nr:excisionase family DNA-binding protein [Spartinivicinus marinus]NYZ69780.1 excisionase family DNA-binding protein [Spartinivicinus marinus]
MQTIDLTTQEAADLLNISRLTFIKLLDDGVIPFTYTGKRRKVLYVDVRNYQKKLESDRLATLEKLSEMDQELGLGY